SPLGFEPKKAPVRFVPELGKFVLYKYWSLDQAPVSSPQPGAGIGIRCGDNGIIGLDFDDDDAALIISDVLPEPLVCKVGERGWTAFYQADFHVPSENFYDPNGRLVMQVLGRGRQTVIPPSIHPDTKKPYYWPNGRSLFDTLPNEHTLLPRDYRELILKLG